MSKIGFYDPLDEYGFLGNFYPSPITLDATEWPTVEHYFQAQKTKDLMWKERIRTADSPAETKQLAWELPDYQDEEWLAKREAVMEKAVRAKFSQNEKLQQKLIETGSAYLYEDAPNDSFWGIGDGSGQNKMGLLLMQIRDELRVQ